MVGALVGCGLGRTVGLARTHGSPSATLGGRWARRGVGRFGVGLTRGVSSTGDGGAAAAAAPAATGVAARGACVGAGGRTVVGLPRVEDVGGARLWRAEGGQGGGGGKGEGEGGDGKARRKGPSEPEVPLPERGAAAVAYLLPLLDALRYGRFLFRDFPLLAIPLLPLQPVVQLYYAFPFVSLIAFFGLYLGVVNNQSFSRYVRYNVMQAILVDILLILPSIAESLTGAGQNAFLESIDSTSFIFVCACFGYAVPQCFQGKLPRLPLVADSVDRQVM